MDETAATWALPPDPPRLAPDEAHVWRIALDGAPEALARQVMSLGTEERARAGRLASKLDRDRFIAAHGALRSILSRYLGVAPAAIAFAQDRFGKPVIEDPPQLGPGALSFNLSHSHQVALVAVCLGRAIGVDVERVRPELAESSIAERFFTVQEVATLRGLPVAAQVEAFFNGWTRKEAFLKARGIGLIQRLDSLTVTLAPGQPASLLSVDDDPAQAGHWRLETLMPWPGYVGALAIACRPCRVTTFHYLPVP